jgi:hypothetical protein
MALTAEALERWRRAKATLAEEQREHDEEWRERRQRRRELDQIIEARKAELRLARRAERSKTDAQLEGVMKFVTARMAKPKETE